MGKQLARPAALLAVMALLALLAGCAPAERFTDFKGIPLKADPTYEYVDLYGDAVTGEHLIFRNGGGYVFDDDPSQTVYEDFVAVPDCQPEGLHPVVCLEQHIENLDGVDAALPYMAENPELLDYVECRIDADQLPWCVAAEQTSLGA